MASYYVENPHYVMSQGKIKLPFLFSLNRNVYLNWHELEVQKTYNHDHAKL